MQLPIVKRRCSSDLHGASSLVPHCAGQESGSRIRVKDVLAPWIEYEKVVAKRTAFVLKDLQNKRHCLCFKERWSKCDIGGLKKKIEIHSKLQGIGKHTRNFRLFVF